MKIVVDENIPLADELFASFGEIVKLPGREISVQDVRHADALLVRSVTKVNRDLLDASKIRFVGTCTIGTDHLDKNYLDSAGIKYASAPGCNAWGVVQYDIAAMDYLGLFNTSLKVGIVGCGNVGGRLYRTLKALGFKCCCYDPFLTAEQIPDLTDWQALFECDIVCVHTPLTYDGPHPTYHMIDKEFLGVLKPGAVLLNAGRGEVVDNLALKKYLQSNNAKSLRVVLDVWENEPAIDAGLAELVDLATPHIAGYSFEGKTNGSLMIYEALAEFLGVEQLQCDATVRDVKKRTYGTPELLQVGTLSDAIRGSYDIVSDDKRLRAALPMLPAGFDSLRKNYPVRREFSHYGVPSALQVKAAALGFGAE